MSRKAFAIAVAATLGLIALAPPAMSARFHGATHAAGPQQSQFTERRTTVSRTTVNRVTSRTSRVWRGRTAHSSKLTRVRTGDYTPRHPRRPGKTIIVRNPGGDGVPPKRPYPHPPHHHHPITGIVVGLPIVGPDSPPVINTTSIPPGSNATSSTSSPPPSGNPGPAALAIRAGFDVPPANERRYRPTEVLLDLGPTASLGSLGATARRHRLTHLETYRVRLTGRTLHRLHIDDGRAVPDVIRGLSGDRQTVAAQPNYLFALQGEVRAPAAAPTDALQYVIAKLHLDEAHQLTTGARVLVAVIDTGIDASHPYLAGTIAESFNAVGGEDTPNEHGTSMAGAIAEHGELTGVAPRARLLSVRAFAPGFSTEATTLAIIKGLDWAVEHGARVINMSFAGPHDPGIAQPIAAAYRRNVVLVAAAGNDGPKSAPLYPAADPHVIAVTATDYDDKLFEHANRGNHIAVAAPGVDVLAPILGGGVEAVTGTSIAAAHVSGVVALLIDLKPSLRPDDVRRILKASASRPGANARADEFGAGMVDAIAAVRALGPTATVGDISAKTR